MTKEKLEGGNLLQHRETSSHPERPDRHHPVQVECLRRGWVRQPSPWDEATPRLVKELKCGTADKKIEGLEKRLFDLRVWECIKLRCEGLLVLMNSELASAGKSGSS